MSKLEDELATMSPVELAKHMVTRGGQSSEALTAMLRRQSLEWRPLRRSVEQPES